MCSRPSLPATRMPWGVQMAAPVGSGAPWRRLSTGCRSGRVNTCTLRWVTAPAWVPSGESTRLMMPEPPRVAKLATMAPSMTRRSEMPAWPAATTMVPSRVKRAWSAGVCRRSMYRACRLMRSMSRGCPSLSMASRRWPRGSNSTLLPEKPRQALRSSRVRSHTRSSPSLAMAASLPPSGLSATPRIARTRPRAPSRSSKKAGSPVSVRYTPMVPLSSPTATSEPPRMSPRAPLTGPPGWNRSWGEASPGRWTATMPDSSAVAMVPLSGS